MPGRCAPAIRPPRSWSEPRVGETFSTVCCFNEIGSEPKLRICASESVSFWVNGLPAPPVIWALPPRIGPWLMAGADSTTPSSTMATWLSGVARVLTAVVSLPKSDAALAGEVELDQVALGRVVAATWPS